MNKKKLPEDKNFFYLILLWTIFCELYLLLTNLLKNRNYYRWLSSQNKNATNSNKKLALLKTLNLIFISDLF